VWAWVFWGCAAWALLALGLAAAQLAELLFLWWGVCDEEDRNE
jgi:hypothetical protein